MTYVYINLFNRSNVDKQLQTNFLQKRAFLSREQNNWSLCAGVYRSAKGPSVKCKPRKALLLQIINMFNFTHC